jgi:hypothetical protein
MARRCSRLVVSRSTGFLDRASLSQIDDAFVSQRLGIPDSKLLVPRNSVYRLDDRVMCEGDNTGERSRIRSKYPERGWPSKVLVSPV